MRKAIKLRSIKLRSLNVRRHAKVNRFFAVLITISLVLGNLTVGGSAFAASSNALGSESAFPSQAVTTTFETSYQDSSEQAQSAPVISAVGKN